MDLKTVISKHGAAKIAENMGEEYSQTINNWAARGLPDGKVRAFCRAINFEITPNELRPDLYPHPDDGLPEELRSIPAVFSNNRRVEQSAARLAHSQEVVGSNPAPATNHERAA